MNEKEIDRIIDKVIKRNNDQNTVVIEDMQSNFKMFGEALSGLGDKVDRVESRLGSLETKFDRLDDKVGIMEIKIDSINDKQDATFEETGNLKTEKADNERVDKIDLRLVGVEKQLV